VLEFRGYEGANPGLALIRDGNSTRSFETLMRYRGAAMAEFWRALRSLKALQAEQAAQVPVAAPAPVRAQPSRLATRPADAHRREPNEPKRLADPRAERCLEYALPGRFDPGRTLHEPASPWLPNEPEPAPGEPAHAKGAAAADILVHRTAWSRST
jgi:hypothetical protein